MAALTPVHDFPPGGLKPFTGDTIRSQGGLIVHESWGHGQRTVMLYRPSADELRVEYRYLPTAEPVSTLSMAYDNSSLPLVSSTIYRNDLVLLPPALRAAITELTQTGQQPSHKIRRQLIDQTSIGLAKEKEVIALEERNLYWHKVTEHLGPHPDEARLAARWKAVQSCSDKLEACRARLEDDVKKAARESAMAKSLRPPKQKAEVQPALSKNQRKRLHKNKVNPLPTKKTTKKKENNKIREDEMDYDGPAYMTASNRTPLGPVTLRANASQQNIAAQEHIVAKQEHGYGTPPLSSGWGSGVASQQQHFATRQQGLAARQSGFDAQGAELDYGEPSYMTPSSRAPLGPVERSANAVRQGLAVKRHILAAQQQSLPAQQHNSGFSLSRDQHGFLRQQQSLATQQQPGFGIRPATEPTVLVGPLSWANHTAAAVGPAAYSDAGLASAADGRRLFIGNLAYATTEEDLRKFFSGYSIESITIPANARTVHPIGYAFVNLTYPGEAERAIVELSGKEILDRKVSVQLARNLEANTEKDESPAIGREGTFGGGVGRQRPFAQMHFRRDSKGELRAYAATGEEARHSDFEARFRTAIEETQRGMQISVATSMTAVAPQQQHSAIQKQRVQPDQSGLDLARDLQQNMNAQLEEGEIDENEPKIKVERTTPIKIDQEPVGESRLQPQPLPQEKCQLQSLQQKLRLLQQLLQREPSPEEQQVTIEQELNDGERPSFMYY